MSAAQTAPRDESLGLPNTHSLILNGMWLEDIAGSSLMPIFEYVCKSCNHPFEALVYGDHRAECPKCHGTKLTQQLSVFAVSAKGASVSSAPAGCGTCGDPRGPGSCSLPDPN
jgi:putative FmdB family regulatory protein